MLKKEDPAKLLNYTAPALLGLVDGIKNFLETQDSAGSAGSAASTVIAALTTTYLARLLSTEVFTMLTETWSSISRSHALDSFPHKLLTTLLQLFR